MQPLAATIITMRLLIIFGVTALVLAAGCEREMPPEDSGRQATASHPWELPGWTVPPELSAVSPLASEPYDSVDEVDLPTRHGPVLPEQDTLDPAILPGLWQQVCYVNQEKLNLIPVGGMNLMELQAGGYSAFYSVQNGETAMMDGNWRKSAAGVVELAFGADGVPQAMYGQLYEDDFLYLWNYENQRGLWFARARPDAAPQIGANRFDTTRGELFLKDVVSQSYQGTVSADNEIIVAGYYDKGVLSMRWEDERGNLGGYAAFIVSEDWQTLKGVWWIDDYQAAPFGGPWNGTKKAAGE
jgi:hypothetical protein